MGAHSGQLEKTYNARGTASYRLEIWHDELNKHRLIIGPDPVLVQYKATWQLNEWGAL